MYRFLVLTLAVASIAQGSSLGRIIGGKDAEDGAHPYQASLQTWTNSHFCGGSILNERWILTAGHCLMSYQLTPRWLRVVVGTNKLNEGGVRYQANRALINPDYIPANTRNDVGLVRLSSNIQFTEKIQPIALPTEPFTKVNYPATLTGWGSTVLGGRSPNELQVITLTIIDQETCEAANERTIDTNMCTLTVPGEGSCHADSGGPLVADGVQVGIVSWGIPCALGYPDVYARVYSFIDWINSRINE